MEFRLLVLLIVYCAYAAPVKNKAEKNKSNSAEENDLKTEASTLYTNRYQDWSRSYPGGYREHGPTGYGTVDNRYYYGGTRGYDNFGPYDGDYSRGRSYGGYGSPEGWYRNGYDSGSKYWDSGYGYSGADVYGDSNSYGAGNGYSYGGNGGYGGYAGNGGLASYYGYNNPSYPGGYHLGYGYYNKKPGYGNIYNNGITPSLVTGYRGYSKK